MSSILSEGPNSLTKTLNLITGGISVLACFWLFHFYSKTAQPRPVSLNLIFLLSVSDLGYSVANVLSAFDANITGLCDLEAMIRLFSMTSGLYWSACISILTYFSFARGKEFQQDLFFKKALVIGTVLPILYSIFPLFTDKYTYGPKKFGCYAVVNAPDTDNEKLAELILVFIVDGIPVASTLLLTLTFYALIVKKVNEMSEHLAIANYIKVKRLFWYPAAIFLAYLPGFVDNVIEIYLTSSVAINIFTALHIIFTHSVGFSNTLVYGWQRKKYYETYEKNDRDSGSNKIDLVAHKQEDNKSEVDAHGVSMTKQDRRSSCEEELIQARSDLVNL